MTQEVARVPLARKAPIETGRGNKIPYIQWIESLGVPIHRGYYIEDARKLEVGPWPELECNAAFLQLEGMEGIADARITEIPPGGTMPPVQFAIDECVYVLDGQGMTTVWTETSGKRTFEWGPRSLFLIPRGAYRQFGNARGDRPARLLHNTYLPLAMSIIPDPEYYFNSGYQFPHLLESQEGEPYSVAKRFDGGRGASWKGNFFTDLAAWNGLVPHRERGGGGHVVDLDFPQSEMSGHMSVFPPGTYKKGHRHGPAVVIVIPAGEGYSIMWPEGGEKVIIPWHEASMFVPPNRWFHQHFNVSVEPARYLAWHCPRQLMVGATGDAVEQIEYPDEEPWIRKMYEDELAKRGLKSLMPEEAYTNRNFKWGYTEGEEQGARLGTL